MPVDTSNEQSAQRQTALIVGGGGGIGAALLARLAADPHIGEVHVWSRASQPALPKNAIHHRVDITDDGSIEQAVTELPPVHLVIVATGKLSSSNGAGPEKSWRELTKAQFMEQFAINAIGPALVAKHVLPRLARHQRAVFAVLSARVSSIEDNRLGGWYSYRASKAALNQIIKTLSIELARSRPQAICVGLHPGTVDTGLSRPFQNNVPHDKLFTPEYAATQLLAVIAGLHVVDSGGLYAWDGARIPF